MAGKQGLESIIQLFLLHLQRLESVMQYFIAFIYVMLVSASMMHGAMVPLPSEPTLTLILKKDLFLLCV